MSWERVPEIRRRMGDKRNEIEQNFSDQDYTLILAAVVAGIGISIAESVTEPVYKVGAVAGSLAVTARAVYALLIGIPKRRRELLENLGITEDDAYLSYIDHEDFMT